MINVPIPVVWSGKRQWITVPPQGYGGIQWMVANLIEGLLEIGQEIILLGAPGSQSRAGLQVIHEAGPPPDIRRWLTENGGFDVVHDHSNGQVFSRESATGLPYLATFHLTGAPNLPRNVVYLSRAQRNAAGGAGAPTIPIPVVTRDDQTVFEKDKYLLFLGRVSRWKGTLEAARFAKAAGLMLRIAGPCWEGDYRCEVEAEAPRNIEWIGEVGGHERIRLLERATALVALSQTVPGPWGHVWVEPGATVVSEAAASGTPVIASTNGCLPEIVPGVGVIMEERGWNAVVCRNAVDGLPSPEAVCKVARERWHHARIAQDYVHLYQRVIDGEKW